MQKAEKKKWQMNHAILHLIITFVSRKNKCFSMKRAAKLGTVFVVILA
jgi:hypothetical protein